MYTKEKLKILLWENDHSYYLNKIRDSLNYDHCEIAAYLIAEGNSPNEKEGYPVIPLENINTTSIPWNYIIVNDFYLSEDLKRIFALLKVKEDCIIYCMDLSKYTSLLKYMLKKESLVSRMIDYYTSKSITPYFSCEADGIKYLQKSHDDTIMRHMYMSNKTFSKYEIDLFVALTDRYYGSNDNPNGLFLDIGANIGTTSIYVKKCINPNIKVVAFEPSLDNFKMLKVNLILNDINDEEFIIENYGISNQNSTNTLVIQPENMGNCSIITDTNLEEGSQKVETIRCVSLDYYFEKNNMDPKNVKYLWVDTEGFEGYVLEGAKKVIEEGNFPIFLEFTPIFFMNNNTADMVLSNIKQMFKSFICIDNYNAGDENLHPIHEIDDLFQEYRNKQTNLFLVK